MEPLSVGQFSLVANLMSFTIAAMGASALYFFLSREIVAPRYRSALVLSGLVVAIAAYHYFRIAESWNAAYTLDNGVYVASGAGFNDAYRYADWLLTVPLLVIELVLVLGLSKEETRSLSLRLGGAAALMVALGYPGEVAAGTGTRLFFWAAAMLPFLYILRVLYTEFSGAIDRQAENVRGLVGNARTVLLVTWSFYPLAYLGPELGLSGSSAETFVQVGYTIADVTAKAGFGLLICAIAKAKSADYQAELFEGA